MTVPQSKIGIPQRNRHYSEMTPANAALLVGHASSCIASLDDLATIPNGNYVLEFRGYPTKDDIPSEISSVSLLTCNHAEMLVQPTW